MSCVHGLRLPVFELKTKGKQCKQIIILQSYKTEINSVANPGLSQNQALNNLAQETTLCFAY